MSEKVHVKTINQKVNIDASPRDVFEALMDSKKHSEFSGGKAVISRKVGGAFTAFDGWAEGKTIELLENKKIVQEWRGSDWPKGHYSIATFSLAKSPTGGTMLTFTQENVPVSVSKDIEKGWKDYYWKPLKKMLEK